MGPWIGGPFSGGDAAAQKDEPIWICAQKVLFTFVLQRFYPRFVCPQKASSLHHFAWLLWPGPRQSVASPHPFSLRYCFLGQGALNPWPADHHAPKMAVELQEQLSVRKVWANSSFPSAYGVARLDVEQVGLHPPGCLRLLSCPWGSGVGGSLGGEWRMVSWLSSLARPGDSVGLTLMCWEILWE